MELLSLSPLLSSLFVSYANRAAALKSASAAPSPVSEEWKDLREAVSLLWEGSEKLKSENLGAAAVSQKVSRKPPRSQVWSREEPGATQQSDIEFLKAELVEVKDRYDRFVADWNAERAAFQIQVLTRQGELEEAVVEQQIKVSKPESFNSLPNPPMAGTATETADTCNLENPEDPNIQFVRGRRQSQGTSDQEAAETKKQEEGSIEVDINVRLNALASRSPLGSRLRNTCLGSWRY